MTTVIGYVDIPSACYTRRVTGSIRGRPGILDIPKTRVVARYKGHDLLKFRYEGFYQTTDNTALKKMEELREQFRNPKFTHPLYINLDKKFFFVLNKFSYDKIGGYKNLWRFNLEVTWIGTHPNIKRTYYTRDFSAITNDWGI